MDSAAVSSARRNCLRHFYVNLDFHRPPSFCHSSIVKAMSQPIRSSNSWISVLPSLVVPVCFGLTLYVGMLGMIRHGVLENETALRYLTGHPVSKVTVAMFLIGASSLGLIAINIFAQFASERHLRFVPLQGDDQASPGADHSDGVHSDDVDKSVALGRQLLDLPRSIQSHYLWQRLTNSLLYVYRNGSASGVDEEVKYLAELDLDRQQQRYSLARILIWATPMLGFLGTVLGISQALGGIAVGPENDFQDMMNGLRGSLYVAFDTTALALTLSMILMFVQFLVDRFETQLLTLVDQRARSEISLQFGSAAAEVSVSDSVEKLGQHLLASTREMMVAQTEIWKKTIHSAEQAWASSLTETNERVRVSWADSIETSLTRIAKSMDGSVSKADESMVRRWKQWQVMLSDNARLMCQQQQELAAQTTALQSLVGKSGNEHSVNEALQGALDAIATTDRLTKAVDGLSAQVDALKVADLRSVESPEVDISAKDSTSANSSFNPAAGEDREEVAVMKNLERAAFRKEVAITRRQSASGRVPKSGGDQRIDVAAIKGPKQEAKLPQESDQTDFSNEVILPIAPYLSGEKSTKRSRFSTAVPSTSNRKSA